MDIIQVDIDSNSRWNVTQTASILGEYYNTLYRNLNEIHTSFVKDTVLLNRFMCMYTLSVSIIKSLLFWDGKNEEPLPQSKLFNHDMRRAAGTIQTLSSGEIDIRLVTVDVVLKYISHVTYYLISPEYEQLAILFKNLSDRMVEFVKDGSIFEFVSIIENHLRPEYTEVNIGLNSNPFDLYHAEMYRRTQIFTVICYEMIHAYYHIAKYIVQNPGR